MKKKVFFHKTACIDKGAQIGSGTKIWHFSHIMKGAKIGKNCHIGQNVVIHPRAVLGNNVKVQNNVSVYDGVTLNDYVFCGPSVVFTNVSRPRSSFPKDPSKEYEDTLISEGATIGANSTVLCGHTLGRFCFIGAGSLVTRDIPDHALVYGNPTRIEGWVCECAQSIVFNSRTKIGVCKKCGRTYKRKANNVSRIKGQS